MKEFLSTHKAHKMPVRQMAKIKPTRKEIPAEIQMEALAPQECANMIPPTSDGKKATTLSFVRREIHL